MAKNRIRCYSLLGSSSSVLSKQKRKKSWLSRESAKRLLKMAFSMADLFLKLLLVVEKIRDLRK